jgi:hypothetical protein
MKLALAFKVISINFKTKRIRFGDHSAVSKLLYPDPAVAEIVRCGIAPAHRAVVSRTASGTR